MGKHTRGTAAPDAAPDAAPGLRLGPIHGRTTDRTTGRTRARIFGPILGPTLGLGLVLGLVLGLAACGDSDPTPSPTTPAPTSPTSNPTTSPTTTNPTPPAIPDTARHHTKAGAKAFVIYFWQVVDYATAKLEPDAVAPLVREDCTGCTAGLEFIKDARRRGATIRGGAEQVGPITARRVKLGNDEYYSVEVTISNTKQRVRYSDGTSKTFPASTVRDHLMLQPTSTGWVVASLEAA